MNAKQSAAVVIFCGLLAFSGVLYYVWHYETYSETFVTKFTFYPPENATHYKITEHDRGFPSKKSEVKPIISKKITIHIAETFTGVGEHEWYPDLTLFYYIEESPGQYVMVSQEHRNKGITVEILKVKPKEDET